MLKNFTPVERTPEELAMLHKVGRPKEADRAWAAELRAKEKARLDQRAYRKRLARKNKQKAKLDAKAAQRLARKIVAGKVVIPTAPPEPIIIYREKPAAQPQQQPVLKKKSGRVPRPLLSYLELEISKVSGVDPLVVHRVMTALGQAILNCWDRADKKLLLPGIGSVEYRYQRGGQWKLAIFPLKNWVYRVRDLLGRPVYKEKYKEAIEKRRSVLTARGEEMGITPRFNDDIGKRV